MTPADDGDPSDDRLIELLSRYDDARTAGEPPPDWSALAPEVRARLDGDRTVLDLLDFLAPPSCDSFLASPVAFPTRFPFRFGRFVVRRRLGAGGCGVVFLADDLVLGRAVALKLPRPETSISPELHGRFLREAQAAAILSHPNIVPVFEADAIGGLCYTASEYCPGPTLAQWSDGFGGTAPVADAASAVAALAAGIGYAHRRGVVHRDLKPSNVLLAPRGEPGTGALSGFAPLIADFGFAKLLEGDQAATASGVVIGTPLYMAPEQAEGRAAAIGPPTDVYALGAILYELLTGRPPLVGTSTPDTLRRIVTDAVRSPQESRPDVPRDLVAICLKCLEKTPARRYPDGDALAADLGRFLAGSPTLARPVRAPARAAMWVRRNPLVAALAALVVTTLVLVAGRESVYRNELGARNAALQNALDREQAAAADADRQREVAVERYRVLRRRTYLAEIREAAALIDRGLLTDRSVGAWEPEYGDDFRGFEWAYLTRLARGTRTWAPYRAPVQVGPITDDGRWCATVAGRELRIWEVPTGRAVAEWTHPVDLDTYVAVSADGRYAATATRGTREGVLLFRRGDRDPRLIKGESGEAESVQLVGFAGADHILVVASGTVRMHHTSNGTPVRTFGEGSHPPSAFGIGPGGGTLAVGFRAASGEHVVLYDTASGRELGRWTFSAVVHHLAISADTRHVLVATDRDLHVWDVGDRRLRSDFRLAQGCVVKAVARLADGRLAALSWPTGERVISLAIWNPRTDQWTTERVIPPCLVYHAQFRPDGRGLVVGGVDSTLHEMDLAPPTPEVGWPVSAPAEAWAVAVSPDGRTVVTGGDDHTVRVWDARSGARLAERTDHESLVTSAVFAPDGRWFATGGFDGRVVVRDPVTAAPRRVLTHGSKVRALAVSPDGGLIAAAGAGGVVSVWDVASGLLLRRLEGTATVIHVLLFDPSGALITAPDETALVWFDVRTGRRVRTVPLPLRPSCLALSPVGGGLAVGFETGQIVALDAAGACEVSWAVGPHSRLNALVFSPDGRTLAAAANNGSVLLRQASTGDILFALSRGGPPVHGMAFAPDGSFLAAARHDGRLAVWPAGDVKPTRR